jgi:hypothetical protein
VIDTRDGLAGLIQTLGLAYPQFFLARHRGQSLPRLHKARVEVTGIKALNDIHPYSPPLMLMQQNSKAVGPMKPLQGSTPMAGKNGPASRQKVLPSIRTQRGGLEKL